MRTSLAKLLPEEPDVPAYPTQDELFEPVSPGPDDGDSDNSVTIELACELEEMTVGDCLEVYWKGEDTWYEGEVTAVDMEDKTFEILYHTDNKKI